LNPREGIVEVSDRTVAKPVVYDWTDPRKAPLPPDVHVAHPGERLPEPESPAPPAGPTEAELRCTLRVAIASREFADENLQRADATHQRALFHVEQCRQRLESFAALDDEVTAATVEALRTGDGRPRVDLDDVLRRRLAEREVAKADVQAAERALTVLAEGLADARADAIEATKAAKHAAVAVSMITAEQMAERVFALEAEAGVLREVLHGADFVGVTSPPALRRIFGDGKRFLRPVDRSAWEAARAALLIDPQAEVVIPVPDSIGTAIDNTVPPAPQFRSHEVVHAVPIRPLHPPETEG